MPDKKVSIIIPCYNSGFTILKTIESLEFQSYKNFEIIIINDGSNDKFTIDALEIISKKKKVNLITTKNQGLAKARNLGIKKSKGSYVFFLDADDWISEEAIEIFVNTLNKNKNLSFVCSNIVNRNFYRGTLRKNINFFEQLFSNQLPYSIFVRKKVFYQVGFYDEKMPFMGFEDWEFNIRLLKNQHIGRVINKELFFYNVSYQGMLNTISKKNYYLLYNYIRNKHKDLYKFSNLLKNYLNCRSLKSTHNLKLYFLYNLLFTTTSKKIFTKVFNIIFKLFSISKRNHKKDNFLFFEKKIKKICHIITGLELGGAEKTLVNLLSNIKKYKKNRTSQIVICLQGPGYFSNQLKKLNVKVYYLNMQPNSINFKGHMRLFKILKKEKISILQSWMYHADLVSGVISFLFKFKIIWTVHNFNISIKSLGLSTRCIVIICSFLSHFVPYKIISVSKAAIKNHVSVGYNKKKFKYIPLGFSKSIFKNEKKVLKKKIKDTIYFGSLSRWNVQKNHKFMLNSLGKLKKNNKFSFKLLLAGNGLDYNNAILKNLIISNNLQENVLLLGPIDNIFHFMSQIDIFLLTSIGESFPNVVCEAMLNKVPVISSDVGDISNIIGHTGWVYPVNNYSSFEKRLFLALKEKKLSFIWNKRKEMAKNRILDNYNINTMVSDYYSLWEDTINIKKN